jgi:CubicO group peptidase (beta-lactamase class C family)
LGSFGHTGFTGTSVWIDRVSQTFVVFLSNRVHPDGKGDVTPLRARVATVAASAIEDVSPIEKFREAENIYWSQVAAQIPKFQRTGRSRQNRQTVSEQRPTDNNDDRFKRH